MIGFRKIFILTVLIILISPFAAFPQNKCSYNVVQQSGSYRSSVVDNFTITDTDGIDHDLYETLDSGKTVFVDLFYTRCSWCQTYAPIIEQIYQDNGQGNGDILMWGISNDSYDTDPVIDQYKSDYGVSNPCAGPQGGGIIAHNTIISGQNFLGWPTYCVICPDHSMFFDPVYPPTVNGFDPYFEQCAETLGTDDQIMDLNTRITSFYPNPVKNNLTVVMYLEKFSDLALNIFDLTGTHVYKREYHLQKGIGSVSLDLSELAPGCYFLKLSQGNIFKDIKSIIVL